MARGVVKWEPAGFVGAVHVGTGLEEDVEEGAGDGGMRVGDCVVQEELAVSVLEPCAFVGEKTDDVLVAGFGGPEDGAVTGEIGCVEVFCTVVEEQRCGLFISAYGGPVERGGLVGYVDLGERGAALEEGEHEMVGAVVCGTVKRGVGSRVGFSGAEIEQEGCEDIDESTVGAEESEEVPGAETLCDEKEQLGGEVEHHCAGGGDWCGGSLAGSLAGVWRVETDVRRGSGR